MKKRVGISLSPTGAAVIKMAYLEQSLVIEDEKAVLFDSADEPLNNHFFKMIKPLCDKKTIIIVGISSEKVIQQDFHLESDLSDEQIMHFLNTQSHQFFGYPAETLCIDYQKIPLDETDHQKISVVAAQKKMIDDIDHAFRRSHLVLNGVDLNECAKKRTKEYQTLNPDFLLNQTMTAAFGLCLWKSV